VEYQTADGEAKRDDAHFCHVAAWEYAGDGKPPVRHEEPLTFETVKLVERSYK
jgi:succinate dehydrogenase / fumarate reductase flavoprotein subunit